MAQVKGIEGNKRSRRGIVSGMKSDYAPSALGLLELAVPATTENRTSRRSDTSFF